jgi:predicted nucleic acid-binding protein
LRIYVESNFLVELALGQEQAGACDSLLSLTERSEVELVIPAYAIMESLEAVVRRLATFDDVEKRLSNMLSQVGRNAALSAEADKLKGLAARVRQSALDTHDNAVARTLSCGRVLPLDKVTLAEAQELRQQLGLRLPDAIMLASVHGDLTMSPPAVDAVFANRNAKDFDEPATRERLAKQRCKMLTNFTAALALVEARTKGSVPPS